MKFVQTTPSAAPENEPERDGRPPLSVLLMGDEARSRRLLAFGLVGEGDLAACVETPEALRATLAGGPHDVALLDWEMKAAPGPAMMAALRDADAGLPVVAIVADEFSAKRARQAGASHHLRKPFSTDELKALLARSARGREAAPAPAARPAPPAGDLPAAGETTSDVFGSRSRRMQQTLHVALKVAPTSASVLILGENGTGKTALARGIHERSQRRRMPFVTVNCPCLQARLLESELFGHVRGAFTGAVSDAPGKVAAAEGGTLFLDEIGELPAEIQPKLLRLLQDRQYERVGEVKTRRANIRVITATNRDLRAEVREGRFREDLFYRLNVITLDMPPLRRRPEDILPLAEEFLRASGGGRARSFGEGARRVLLEHCWPGNLRELRNVVERAAILSDREVLEAEDFPLLMHTPRPGTPQVGDFVTLAELEEAHIREVMARTETLGHAADILGINATTLYRKRKRLPAETALGAPPLAQPA